MRTRRSLGLVVIALVLAGPASSLRAARAPERSTANRGRILATAAQHAAQVQDPAAPPTQSGTSMIAGRVVDAATGAPIGGADLYLTQSSGSYQGRVSKPMRAETDGSFVFADLPSAEFRLSASAAGYLSSDFGKRRPNGYGVSIPLRAGQRFDRATIELLREATISGVIRDEHGRVIPEVAATALRRVRGTDWFESVGGRTSVVNGRYTIGNLPPGDYVIAVRASRTTMRQMPANANDNCAGTVTFDDIPGLKPDPNAPKPPPPPLPRPIGTLYSKMWNPPAPASSEAGTLTYETTFYPGGNDIASAAVISLGSGEPRDGIDFQLRPVAAVNVQGRVLTPAGYTFGNASRISLHPLYAKPEQWSIGMNDADGLIEKDGTFVFVDVPAGRYRLNVANASSNGCHGSTSFVGDINTTMTVDVPAAGLHGLEVPMATPFTATRHVYAHGSDGVMKPASMSINVSRADGAKSGYAGHDAGTDQVIGLYAGDYIVSASDNSLTTRWFVASIEAGGVDLTGTPLGVTGPSIPDLVIVATDIPSPLDGVVVTPNGALIDDATVIVFPIDKRLWPRAHPWMQRFGQARAFGGKFRFPHLVPGDYFVAAVDERRMSDWPRAEFLETMAKSAAPVRIKAGVAQTLTLTMKPR